MKKHPFINAKYYRAGIDPVFQRMITESRAARHIFDFVSIKGSIMLRLKERGLIAPYKSVHQSAYGPGFYYREGILDGYL